VRVLGGSVFLCPVLEAAPFVCGKLVSSVTAVTQIPPWDCPHHLSQQPAWAENEDCAPEETLAQAGTQSSCPSCVRLTLEVSRLLVSSGDRCRGQQPNFSARPRQLSQVTLVPLKERFEVTFFVFGSSLISSMLPKITWNLCLLLVQCRTRL
jgi:hypothetical protein